MKNTLVLTRDNGIVDLSTFPCSSWLKELINNRIFDTEKLLQQILLVADVSEEAYDRGLGCPADARNAIKIIESAPKFKPEYGVMISHESGKELYQDLQEMYRQKRILWNGKIEDPCPGRKFWQVEVIDEIKEV